MAEVVLSDVHIFADKDAYISNNDDYQTYLTRFYFMPKLPKEHDDFGTAQTSNNLFTVTEDDDGDAVIPERPRSSKHFVTLEHSLGTLLNDVGHQVWRGSMFMCDFLLDFGDGLLLEKSVLELGCGTGMCSVIAGMYADKVYCTDVGEVTLQMCKRNVRRNKGLYDFRSSSKSGCGLPIFNVKELDWQSSENQWNLSEEECRELLDTDIIIAADVIYEEHLTNAFFASIMKLMKTGKSKILYLSVEKRINFTMDDLDIVAPSYSYFIDWLRELLMVDTNWKSEKLNSNFKQYLDYERVDQLELWKIEYSVK